MLVEFSEDRFATVNGAERKMRDIKKRLDDKFVPAREASHLKQNS